MLAKYFLAIGNFSTVRLDLEYHRFLRCPLVRYHSNVMEINTHAPTREKCVEIIKTLHVKFFPFGSVEPVRSVSVKINYFIQKHFMSMLPHMGTRVVLF